MGSITNFLETELLDHVFNVAYAHPATVYLVLCTADPTDAATGAACNEVADAGAYARQAISFGAAAARTITQDALITFPACTVAWGHVSHWCITDNAAHGAGNAMAHGEFAVHKDIIAGNTASVAIGEIYVEFSAGEISDYLANALLGFAFDDTDYAKPETHVALSTVAIIDADTTLAAKEVADAGAYARKQVNINGGAAPTWDLAVEGDPSYVDNTAAITFVECTVAWGTVIAVAICDSGVHNGGNMLFYDNTMADQAVDVGDTAEFAIGVLDIQMS